MKKIFLIILSLSVFACTDLDLKPANADVDAAIFQDPENYKSYLAKIYAAYTITGQEGPAGDADISIVNDEGFTSYIRAYWKAQELTTDEAVIAWTDAGIRDLHSHVWGSNNQFMRVLYYRIFYIIGYANDFLTQSTPAMLAERGISSEWQDVIAGYRAEARFLRAMAYWHALDMFRNVPITTKITTSLPVQATPLELFTFIETELNEIEAELPAPMTNEYGRADQAALWMLQSKLYLNAEVYIGEDRYTDVITACNKVINAGYSLHANYHELWMADNHELANSEIIYAIPHDGDSSKTWGGTTFLVHAAIGGSMVPTDYGVGDGWGGTRTTYSMIEKFGDTTDIAGMDPRHSFYAAGQTADINSIAEFTDGWAVAKWTNVSSTGVAGVDPDFVDTDYPMFRLGDTYLTYAEAVLRGGTGGDRATALGYVNDLRERAYGNTSNNIVDADLDLDFLLDERVRELYWEGGRRIDLIRYGRFSDSGVWPWKGGVKEGVVTESYHDIFPIPSSDLNVNSNLKQNEGY